MRESLRTRTALLTSSMLLLAIPTVLPAGQEITTFADVAPKNSFFAVSVGDMDRLLSDLETTPLGEMWHTPQMQDFLVVPLEQDFLNDLNEYAGTDYTLDSLPRPTGLAGFAIYPDESGDEEAPTMRMMMAAEFGPNAEEAGTLLRTLLENADLDDEETVFEEEPFEQFTILSLYGPEEEDIDADVDPEAAEDADLEEFEEEFADDGWEDDLFGSPEVHMAWAGSLLLVCTDQAELQSALIDLEIGDRGTLSENQEYLSALGLAGTDAHVEAFGSLSYLMSKSPWAVLGEMAEDPEMTGFMETMGIADLEAVAMTMHAGGSPETLVNWRLGASIPSGRTGLFKLLQGSEEGFTAPTWLDADASSITEIRIAFDQIVPLIRDVITQMPEDSGMSQPFEQQIAPVLTSMFEVMGPWIYMATWPSDPDSEDLEASMPLYAVQCSDLLTLENTLSPFLGMGGFVARDFQGFRIYDMDTGFAVISLGFAKGHVFAGGTQQVERALRGGEDVAQLGSQPAFQTAAESLPAGAPMYAFAMIRTTVEEIVEQLRYPFDEAAIEETIDQERQWYAEMEMSEFFDPEMYRPEKPTWYDGTKVPDADFFLRYIGDMTSMLEMREAGVVLQSRLHTAIER